MIYIYIYIYRTLTTAAANGKQVNDRQCVSHSIIIHTYTYIYIYACVMCTERIYYYIDEGTLLLFLQFNLGIICYLYIRILES